MKIKSLVCIIPMLFSFSSQSQTSLVDLFKQGDLFISSQVAKEGAVSVGEQQRVIIDIETSTWFTKGTQIGRFEIDNAIVLMQQANVVNSTTRINGKTYASQRWDIPVYPLVSGQFKIAPITVNLQVKGDEGDISGTVTTKPLQFSSHLVSPNMSDETAWLVADDVNLSQRIEPKTESEIDGLLQVGDSLTRTVVITAKETNSMLVPTLMSEQNWPASVRVYVNQPDRSDKQQRGIAYAHFEQTMTIIMQQPGNISIPEIKLLWWNPETEKEQWLSVPEKTWQVKHTPLSFLKMYWIDLIIVFVFLTGTTVAITRFINVIKTRAREDRLPLWAQFWAAMSKKQMGRVKLIIYRALLTKHGHYQMLDAKSPMKWDENATKIQKQYSHSGKSINEAKTLQSMWKKINY